jgi:DNA-binding transcriptional LysR family regulator
MISILFIDIKLLSIALSVLSVILYIVSYIINGDTNMELTHLRYFVAVAEELHFGRAAAKLHIAQPALSQQIKRLEGELNTRLFNRTSRRVELSAAGKIFLNKAHGIIERADEACAAMMNLGKGQSGYLAMAYIESVLNTFLPKTIKKFMHKYPEVQLSLKEMGIIEQFKALDEKRLDLGFMRPFGHDTSAYSKRLVLSEQYVLAMPANHKLCANSLLTLDMIGDEPLILFPRAIHPQLRYCFDECFQRADFKPNIIQELTSKRTTLALVETGIALAFVPESSMIHSPSGVEFRKLDCDLPDIKIFALWRPENDSPLIKNFLDFIP